MPTLNWIGKEAVVKHHKEVPFRLLEPVAELSCETPPGLPLSGEENCIPPDKGGLRGVRGETGNLIVQGDNLHALKALLPRYAGKVKCIYIDPPYNTGNEGWAYNDNVNSAEIKKWLGEVVGREGETLDRHDRWLCMMYPRLLLLKQFLRDDGAIFVSIDDNEVATLRLLMDEIFGLQNFIASVIWQKKQSPQSDAINLSDMHDYVIVYARKAKQNRQDASGWDRHLLPRGNVQDARFENPDNDPRGQWTSTDYTCNKTADERPNLFYPIVNPNTGDEILPSRTRVWAYEQDAHGRNVAEGRLWWGANGRGRPRIKKYLSEVTEGIVPTTWWTREFAGDNQESRRELRSIFANDESAPDFSTPKPSSLIQRILQIATDKDSLILDSFAGSGTTGHAVLKQNAEDGGNRRFILVEMDDNIARNVTAERVRRVSNGYINAKEQRVEGLGGGFQFCTLSKEPLFTAAGQIRSDVTFAQLAEFVWFVETGTGLQASYSFPFKGKVGMGMGGFVEHVQPHPLPSPPLEGEGTLPMSPLLGIHEGRAIYLLYNGILKDKSVAGGNVLTGPVYEVLPAYDGAKVIYAAACRLGAARLHREGIVFKQTPYALAV
jgi:site-specific DNA-methyltransferase (adenine-specific)/adenine-specific DNA-methyltransferase